MTKHGLRTAANKREKGAFDEWWEAHRQSKNSQQVDLPSSQLRPKASLVKADFPQIFAVIDTCSIVKYRIELIEYVTLHKRIFPDGTSPIKFIISMTVLEELDKFNRRKEENKTSNQQQLKKFTTNNNNSAQQQQQISSQINQRGLKTEKRASNEGNYIDLIDLNQGSNKDFVDTPPRSFMRILEEELRSSDILVPDLDPKKVFQNQENGNFEIINNDDRILDCCVRSSKFITSMPHHPDTLLVLITEDNVFKSKATTLDIVSYRWYEFKLKYKNFGLNNYTQTPNLKANCSVSRLAYKNSNNNDNSDNNNLIQSVPSYSRKAAGPPQIVYKNKNTQKFKRMLGDGFMMGEIDLVFEESEEKEEKEQIEIVHEVINIEQ